MNSFIEPLTSFFLFGVNLIYLTRDAALVKKIGAATALEVRATGIPYVFAPCIAVSEWIKFPL